MNVIIGGGALARAEPIVTEAEADEAVAILEQAKSSPLDKARARRTCQLYIRQSSEELRSKKRGPTA